MGITPRYLKDAISVLSSLEGTSMAMPFILRQGPELSLAQSSIRNIAVAPVLHLPKVPKVHAIVIYNLAK